MRAPTHLIVPCRPRTRRSCRTLTSRPPNRLPSRQQSFCRHPEYRSASSSSRTEFETGSIRPQGVRWRNLMELTGITRIPIGGQRECSTGSEFHVGDWGSFIGVSTVRALRPTSWHSSSNAPRRYWSRAYDHRSEGGTVGRALCGDRRRQRILANQRSIDLRGFMPPVSFNTSTSRSTSA